MLPIWKPWLKRQHVSVYNYLVICYNHHGVIEFAAIVSHVLQSVNHTSYILYLIGEVQLRRSLGRVALSFQEEAMGKDITEGGVAKSDRNGLHALEKGKSTSNKERIGCRQVGDEWVATSYLVLYNVCAFRYHHFVINWSIWEKKKKNMINPVKLTKNNNFNFCTLCVFVIRWKTSNKVINL